MGGGGGGCFFHRLSFKPFQVAISDFREVYVQRILAILSPKLSRLDPLTVFPSFDFGEVVKTLSAMLERATKN